MGSTEISLQCKHSKLLLYDITTKVLVKGRLGKAMAYNISHIKVISLPVPSTQHPHEEPQSKIKNRFNYFSSSSSSTLDIIQVSKYTFIKSWEHIYSKTINFFPSNSLAVTIYHVWFLMFHFMTMSPLPIC